MHEKMGQRHEQTIQKQETMANNQRIEIKGTQIFLLQIGTD